MVRVFDRGGKIYIEENGQRRYLGETLYYTGGSQIIGQVVKASQDYHMVIYTDAAPFKGILIELVENGDRNELTGRCYYHTQKWSMHRLRAMREEIRNHPSISPQNSVMPDGDHGIGIRIDEMEQLL